MKACSKCKIIKPLEDFNRQSAVLSGRRSRCRVCQSKEGRAYHAANREKASKQNAEYYRLKKYGSPTAEGPGRGRWGARPRAGLPNTMTPVERQVIIGSLLGDGSMSMYKRSLFPAFRERHALAQGEYLRWKGCLLTRFQPYIREHNATVAGKTHPGLFLSTPQVPIFEEFMAFYKDGHKTVPEFAVSELNLLALAIWIQDDGHLCSADSNKRLRHPYIEINSQSFSEEDNERLCNRVRTILVSPKVNVIKSANGTGWKLLLGVDATRSMAEFCAPHWHSSMDYKFPYPKLLTSDEEWRENRAWLALSESAFAEDWNNPLDAQYDDL